MKRLACLLLCTLCLCACGSDDSTSTMTPAPLASTNQDPSDSVLFDAVTSYLSADKRPKNSQYQYARIDLNGDGLRDGLVLLTLPHSYWCGWAGCTMLVYEARRDHFVLNSEIIRVRGPIVVSEERSMGWRDIVIRVSGATVSDTNVRMRFNGRRYPDSPLSMSGEPGLLYDVAGARFFP